MKYVRRERGGSHKMRCEERARRSDGGKMCQGTCACVCGVVIYRDGLKENRGGYRGDNSEKERERGK